MNKFLLTIIFIFLFLNCKTIKEEGKNSDFLIVNELKINEKFLKLIIESKKTYKEKFGFEPKVLLVDLIKEESYISIVISPMESLYEDKEEKDFMAIKFMAGVYIDETFVLLNKTIVTDTSPFFKIKNSIVKYKLSYGNIYYFCRNFYYYKDRVFLKQDSYCSG
jgi:hypothetical protein